MEFAELFQNIGLPNGVLNFACGLCSLVENTLSKSPVTGIISSTGSVYSGQQKLLQQLKTLQKSL